MIPVKLSKINGRFNKKKRASSSCISIWGSVLSPCSVYPGDKGAAAFDLYVEVYTGRRRGLQLDSRGSICWQEREAASSLKPHIFKYLMNLLSNAFHWICTFIAPFGKLTGQQGVLVLIGAGLQMSLSWPSPFATQPIWKTILLNALNNYSNYR